MLPANWKEKIDRGQVAELSALASRYQQAASPAPNVTSVKDILRRLGSERSSPPKTWWDRFKDWVRSWFEDKSEHDLSWIDRWVDRLRSATGFFTALTFVFVAVVLLGAVVFVVRELKASGVLASKDTRVRRSAERASAGEEADVDVSRAALLEQPALLLAALVRQLKLGGGLATERHLTHRELPRAVRLSTPDQHDRLTALSLVAETVLYGAQPPRSEQLERALEGGRKLLLELGEAGAVR